MNTTPFPVIDLAATGRNIQRLREERDLTVRDLQAYFGFEEPQAIYKWQKGKSLPTVDNLYALAALLQVTVDDILVPLRLHILSRIPDRLPVVIELVVEWLLRLALPHFRGDLQFLSSGLADGGRPKKRGASPCEAPRFFQMERRDLRTPGSLDAPAASAQGGRGWWTLRSHALSCCHSPSSVSYCGVFRRNAKSSPCSSSSPSRSSSRRERSFSLGGVWR